MQLVHIVDTTLRDGEQAPGVAFSAQVKAEIAGLLSELGVSELEIGTPAMGEREIEAIRNVSRLGLRAPLIAWARAVDADVDMAARCDVPFVHISFPVSERHLGLIGWSRPRLFDEVDRMLSRARAQFDGVSVGALDATRAETEVLELFAQVAAAAGARRMRIADTVGLSYPSSLERLIARIRIAAPELELEFHGHDDLGMATANTIAAVEAGASAVSVTANGIGERAGNAPLEEVAFALDVLGLAATGVDCTKLSDVSRRIAELSMRPLSKWKPVVGSAIFAHESGIHVAALLRDPRAYQAFLPSEVGMSKTVFVVGKHSGSAAVRDVLGERGIEADDSSIARLLVEVRHAAESKQRWLAADEVEELFWQTQTGNGSDRRPSRSPLVS